LVETQNIASLRNTDRNPNDQNTSTTLTLLPCNGRRQDCSWSGRGLRLLFPLQKSWGHGGSCNCGYV